MSGYLMVAFLIGIAGTLELRKIPYRYRGLRLVIGIPAVIAMGVLMVMSL